MLTDTLVRPYKSVVSSTVLTTRSCHLILGATPVLFVRYVLVGHGSFCLLSFPLLFAVELSYKMSEIQQFSHLKLPHYFSACSQSSQYSSIIAYKNGTIRQMHFNGGIRNIVRMQSFVWVTHHMEMVKPPCIIPVVYAWAFCEHFL